MIPKTCEKCAHVLPNYKNGGWKECKDSEPNKEEDGSFVPGKDCVYRIMEKKQKKGFREYYEALRNL